MSESARFEPLPPVEKLLVISGSAAPGTASQIDLAIEEGFLGVRIDAADLVDPTTREEEQRRVGDEARSALADGDSVVLYTARGPDDPAIDETRERARQLANPPESLGRTIGTVQGALLRSVLEETDVERVCVAGGDTCGYATPAIDVYALETRFPLAPGAPMCRARSRTDAFDGLEIALKGGQLGGRDFFVRARDGADEWVTE